MNRKLVSLYVLTVLLMFTFSIPLRVQMVEACGTAYPEWMKVEFLSVEGTNATARVTMHMSDETEQNATALGDVVAGIQALGLWICHSCQPDSWRCRLHEWIWQHKNCRRNYRLV